MATREALDRTFAILETAAVKGERCPQTTGPDADARIKSDHPQELARAGRVRIEIYAHNYRRITILTGPHAGAKTTAHPNQKLKPWKVIGTETYTTRSPIPVDVGQSKRAQPSAPRLLSKQELAS